MFLDGLSSQEEEDYGQGNRLSGRGPLPPAGGRAGQPDLSRDVGQFPYPRGETPVFNFDQGDEVRDSAGNQVLEVDDVIGRGSLGQSRH